MNPINNLTGMLWYIDVHVIDSPGAADLRRMNKEGWIYLQITDTMLTEIGQADEPKRKCSALTRHRFRLHLARW
jgi:hypothetical protein